MKTIVLHGDLATKFIDRIDLEINSLGEVIRALCANFKGFEQYISEYKPGFHIKYGKDIYLSKDDINIPIPLDEIHIVPAIAGSGKGGLIIAGIALLLISQGGAAGFLAQSTSAGFAAGVSQIGLGLVLAGISAVLFAPPKETKQVTQAGEPSKYFNGIVNTVSQGYPVSIGYGELLVGSAVISAGIYLDNSSTSNYVWIFSEVNQDGWVSSSAGVYYNTIFNIYYYEETNTYRHTIHVDEWIPPSLVDDIWTNGYTASVEYTYEFSAYENRFRRLSPACLTGLILDNGQPMRAVGEWCAIGGSSTIPPTWGREGI